MNWGAMPRRPLLQGAACTDATPHPRHGHRRTTCCTSRSAPSPDICTAHRQATRPDTSAPGPLLFLPSARLMPPFYACLSQVHWVCSEADRLLKAGAAALYVERDSPFRSRPKSDSSGLSLLVWWDEQFRVRESYHLHKHGSDCAATCGYRVTAFARILAFQFG